MDEYFVFRATGGLDAYTHEVKSSSASRTHAEGASQGVGAVVSSFAYLFGHCATDRTFSVASPIQYSLSNNAFVRFVCSPDEWRQAVKRLVQNINGRPLKHFHLMLRHGAPVRVRSTFFFFDLFLLLICRLVRTDEASGALLLWGATSVQTDRRLPEATCGRHNGKCSISSSTSTASSVSDMSSLAQKKRCVCN